MGSHEIFEDIYDDLSPDLRIKVKEAVLKLYSFNLPNAKEVFDDLLQELEEAVGIDTIIVHKLTRKFMYDIKNYVSYDDGAWFINQRFERVGKDHFGTLVICQVFSTRVDGFENHNEHLLEVAKIDGDAIKMFLATVLMALHHQEHNRDMIEAKNLLKEIQVLEDRANIEVPAKDRTDHHNYYLEVSFTELGFLFRELGYEEFSVTYFKKAVEICDKVGNDLGQAIRHETFLIRVLQKRDYLLEEKESLGMNLVKRVKSALADREYFESLHGIKILREGYIEASRQSMSLGRHNYNRISKEVIQIGHMVYDSLKDQFGQNHHEVIFTASQMAIHYHKLRQQREADLFFKLTVTGIEHIGEESRILVHTKARTASNLCRILNSGKSRNLPKAEKFCREQIRLNKINFENGHQFIAQALRQLAYIVKDQGRREEGLGYLEECVRLSRECSPGFVSFHDQVDQEIWNF